MESTSFAPCGPGTMMHNGAYVASRAAIGKKIGGYLISRKLVTLAQLNAALLKQQGAGT